MRNESGQSMIELMVSIVIITVALSGVVAIFPYIIQKNARIGIQEQAANLLQSEAEKLRARRYYDEELNALGSPDGMSITKNEGNFIIRTIVKYVDPVTGKPPEKYPSEVSEDTGLKEVSISVKNKNNIGSQVNLVTYFSRAKPGKS